MPVTVTVALKDDVMAYLDQLRGQDVPQRDTNALINEILRREWLQKGHAGDSKGNVAPMANQAEWPTGVSATHQT